MSKLGWEALEIGKCYESNRSHMKMDNQYLGKLVSSPVKGEFVKTGEDPIKVGRGGGGGYVQGYSAEFENRGQIVRRYQIKDEDTKGLGHIGFYFNEVACQGGGGKRKRRQSKKQKRSTRRRSTQRK